METYLMDTRNTGVIGDPGNVLRFSGHSMPVSLRETLDQPDVNYIEINERTRVIRWTKEKEATK